MELISLRTPVVPAPDTATQAGIAMAGVVASIGEPDFVPTVLRELNRLLPIGWMAVYRLLDDGPPEQYIAGALGVADGTDASWQIYRCGLYRRDRTFLAARDAVTEGDRALMRWDAREIPFDHRRAIYTRHGLRERVSLIQGDSARSLLAVNFYRGTQQPAFLDREIDLLGSVSPILVAAVERHLVFRHCACAAGPDADTDSDTAASTDDPAPPLLASLPRREREVCQRMLRGWTYDGIAADLGISSGTVKTYRDRAFERLGLHYRSELFALVMADAGRRPRRGSND